MSRASIVSLLGLCVAGFASTRVEGTLSTGILSGYLLGAAAALLSGLWVAHTIRHRPEHAMRALLMGFFLKFTGLLAAALCLRFIAAAAAVADYRSFILAYTGAAVLVLLITTLDNSRSLRAGTTS